MFQTKGAGAAASATENVTKAQTRLGQTSASAGRQFSAQAAGLGGLVAAYAGAAANVFAITQAFTALQRAARAEATIAGTETLAAAVGENANSIIGNLKRITQGQLSTAEAATAANFALSSGFDSTQIEGLALVATKASKALGRDLTDSLSRLTRGVAKIEPEILDELGIIVRLDDAVKKYAQTIGKAAGDLTTFERSQAFANAVIEQGTNKYASIDEKASSTIKTFEQLSAKVQDLVTQIGGLVASALGPLVEFISGNFLNVLSSVGLVGGLVFGKLGQVAKEGLTNVGNSLDNAGQKVSNFFDKSGGRGAARLKVELKKVDLSFKGLAGQLTGLTQKERLAAQGLLKLARDGNITAAQMKQLDVILKKTTGTLVSLAPAATAADRAVQGLGRAALFASRAASFAGKAFGLAAKGVNLFIGAVSKIFFVVSIIQLVSSTLGKLIFGVDPLVGAGEKVKKFFEEFRQGAQKAKAAAEASKAAVSDLAGTSGILENAFKGKETTEQKGTFFGTNPVKVKEAQAEIQQILEEGNSKLLSSSKRSFIGSGAVNNQLAQLGIDPASRKEIMNAYQSLTNEQRAAIARSKNVLSDASPVEFREGIVEAAVDAQIAKIRKEFPQFTDAALEALKQAQIKRFNIFAGLEENLAESIKASQTAAGALAKAFSEKFFAVVGKEGNKATFTEKVTKDFDALLDTLGRNEEGEPFLNTLKGITFELGKGKSIDLQNRIKDLVVQFTNGSLNATQLAQKIKVLNNSLKEKGVSESLKTALVLLRRIGQEQEQIEKVSESFRKLFPNDALKQGERFVMITENGIRLIKNEREAREAATRSLIKFSQYQGKDNKLKKLAEESLQALARQYAKNVQEIDKMEKSMKKLNDQLTLQLNTLKNQLSINKFQNEIKNRAADRKAEEDVLKRTTSLNKSNLALEQEKTRAANLQLTLQIAQKNALIETAKYNLQIAQIESNRRKANIEDADRRRRLRLEEAKQEADAFSNLYTAAERRGLDRKALELDVTKARALYEEEKALSLKEQGAATEIYNQRKAIAELEFKKGKALLDIRKKQIEESQRAAKAELDLLQKRAAGTGLKDDQKARDEIARLTKQNADAQAAAAKVTRDLQIQKTKDDAQFILDQTTILEQHPKAMAEVFNSFLEGMKTIVSKIPGVGAIGDVKVTAPSAANADIKTRAAAVVAAADKALKTSAEIYKTQVRLNKDVADQAVKDSKRVYEQERDDLKNRIDILKNTGEIAKSQLKSIGTEGKLLEATRDASITAAEREKNLAIKASEDKVEAARKSANAAQEALQSFDKMTEILNDKFRKVANAAAGIINSRLDKGLDDLFTAMKNGTLTMENFKQGVKDLFKDIVFDIGKSIVKEYVLQPVKDFVSTGIRSLVDTVTGSGEKNKQLQTQNFNNLAATIKTNGAEAAAITGDAIKSQTDLLTKTFGEITNVQIVGQVGPLLVTTSGQGLSGLGGKAAGGVGGLGKGGTSFDGTTSDTQFGYGDLDDLQEGMDMSGFQGSLTDYATSVGYDMNGITDASQMVGMEFSALGDNSFSLGNSFMNLGNIAQMAGAGLGGLIGGAIGGPAGSAIGSIIGTIGGLFLKSMFLSSGGLVNGYGAVGRMAGGGAVHRFAGGGLQRDSVPALLEPGEFVMRKSAVDSVGLPAMERMNATGNSGMPPVKIQIENSGQEKDAEQGESMMDGEAMVVKLILKDLKSNGPIRKSIRANGR